MNIMMLYFRPVTLSNISQNEEASFHLLYWMDNGEYKILVGAR